MQIFGVSSIHFNFPGPTYSPFYCLTFDIFSIPVTFDIHHGTHFGDMSKIGTWATDVLKRLAKFLLTSTVSIVYISIRCSTTSLHWYLILILRTPVQDRIMECVTTGIIQAISTRGWPTCWFCLMQLPL